MHLDHVVIWVEDPVASMAFFAEVVGLAPVRLDEFRAKKVMMDHNFGAHGVAPNTFYFTDPDGNVFEARHYGA